MLEFSRQILDSLTFAQSKNHHCTKEAQLDRVKRGILSVAKQGIMGVALGAAGAGGGEAPEDVINVRNAFLKLLFLFVNFIYF